MNLCLHHTNNSGTAPAHDALVATVLPTHPTSLEPNRPANPMFDITTGLQDNLFRH